MTNEIETGERVAVACPSCSPGAETVHEVLRPGGQATVRCSECGHVHKTRIEREREVDLEVIVSQDGDSRRESVETPAGQTVSVGDEFVLETEEAIHLVRVTSVELEGDRRVESAPAEEARAVWTRAVDNVSVNVTVHPNDGRRDKSRSVTTYVPGDHEFTVGEEERAEDEEFRIVGIHLRDDVSGYHHTKLDHDGDTVPAKDVKRLYGEDVSSSAWSAW